MPVTSPADVYEVERLWLRLDGDRVPVDVVGPEDGLPIMVIHGFTASPGVYAKPNALLAKKLRARVFAVTLKGYMGTSCAPLTDNTYKPHADFVIAQKTELQRLGAIRSTFPNEPVVVIGHSKGGATGLKVVHDFPREVMGYIGVNTIGGYKLGLGYLRSFMSKRTVIDIERHVRLAMDPEFRSRASSDYLQNLRNVAGILRSGIVVFHDGLEDEAGVVGEREMGEHFHVLAHNPTDGLVFARQVRALSRALRVPIVILGEGHSPMLTDPEHFVAEISPRIRNMEKQWLASLKTGKVPRSGVGLSLVPPLDRQGSGGHAIASAN